MATEPVPCANCEKLLPDYEQVAVPELALACAAGTIPAYTAVTLCRTCFFMFGESSFVSGYLECAVWASPDMDNGETLDSEYDWTHIDARTLSRIVADCHRFATENASDLEEAEARGRPMDHLGHDFFLTRNGHGVGFWDRGLGDLGDRLSKACDAYKSSSLWPAGYVNGSPCPECEEPLAPVDDSDPLTLACSAKCNPETHTVATELEST